LTATKITSESVGLCLSHSGGEGSPKTLLGRSGCVYLIPTSKATKTTSRPYGSLWCQRVTQFILGLSGCVNLIPASKPIKTTSGPIVSCLSHSGVEKLPRPLRGRPGRILLIPASNVTQTTFRPVGLTISHSGIKDHPDHFWVGGAASTSFYRGRPPRLLLVRSSKKKAKKKIWRLLGFEPIPF
jgi:hypothetical protein